MLRNSLVNRAITFFRTNQRLISSETKPLVTQKAVAKEENSSKYTGLKYTPTGEVTDEYRKFLKETYTIVIDPKKLEDDFKISEEIHRTFSPY